MNTNYVNDAIILVNANHPYQASKEVTLAKVKNSQDIYLESAANDALNSLMDEINGWDYIVAVSGYRSYDEQLAIYKRSLFESGEEFTRKYVAKAGCSEHQTGLAIDLALLSDNIDFICPNFPNEGICQKFRELSSTYGFIERYGKDKEAITNIAYEPWHFRYVGFAHAIIITKLKLALEEYHDLVRKHEYNKNPLIFKWNHYLFEVAYLIDLSCLKEVDVNRVNSILSNDNRGGYIYAKW